MNERKVVKIEEEGFFFLLERMKLEDENKTGRVDIIIDGASGVYFFCCLWKVIKLFA